MRTRNRAINSIKLRLFVCEAHGRGRRRAISKSNSRNVIATRKNFIEKGRRADPIGSNPHSYGLAFSVYTFNWGNQNATEINRREMDELIKIVNMRFIILSWFIPELIDWKSTVLINTKRI